MRALLFTFLLIGAASCGAPPGPEGAEGPAGPAGAGGPAGGTGSHTPSVLEALSPGFTTIADDTWRDVPGLTIQVTLVGNATPVEIGWILSFLNNRLVTRIVVDGDAMPGTASVSPNYAYQAASGTYRTTLDAGTHTVSVQYRTLTSTTYKPDTDFESSRIDLLHW